MSREFNEVLREMKEQEVELLKQIADSKAKLNWHIEHERLQKIYFPKAETKPLIPTNTMIHLIGASICFGILLSILVRL